MLMLLSLLAVLALLSVVGAFVPSMSRHATAIVSGETRLSSATPSSPRDNAEKAVAAGAKSLLLTAGAVLLSSTSGSKAALAEEAASASASKVLFEPLPYSYTALAPFIDELTMQIHHDKHYGKYVTTTNALIKGGSMESDDLVTIMKKSKSNKDGALFNNAAQSWNHAFYWKGLAPSGGGGAPKVGTKIAALIDSKFGSYDAFRKELATAGNTQFGSGWAWLTYDPKSKGLSVSKSINAENPLTDGLIPLLTIDVWEHAYYIKYQNKRAEYVDAVLDHLVNWDFVEANLIEAQTRA